MCKTSHASNRPKGVRAGGAVSREAQREEEKSHSFVNYASRKESRGKSGGVKGFLETIGNWKIVNSKTGGSGAGRNL